jgi:hypothetical protein
LDDDDQHQEFQSDKMEAILVYPSPCFYLIFQETWGNLKLRSLLIADIGCRSGWNIGAENL